MKRTCFALVAILAIAALPRTAYGAGSTRAVIVVLKNTAGSTVTVEQRHARAFGLTRKWLYSSALKGYSADVPENRLAELRNDKDVLYVANDQSVSADASAPAEALPTGVDRVDAENKAATGNSINVAVIDSGIDTSHPDLAANVVGGKNCSTGKNYVDLNDHGTHVAGTIAAVHNTIGVVGAAPKVDLWAVRVLNAANYGAWSDIICGIDFVDSKSPARGGPIRIANMSLGGVGTDDGACGTINQDPVHRAICNATSHGVTFVVSAGNAAANIANFIPAAYDEVITVSALVDSDGQPCGSGPPNSTRSGANFGADDTFATFSNYATGADLGHLIAAPGDRIFSTIRNRRYAYMSGTSMAAPLVSAAAALYVQMQPTATPSSIRTKLLQLAEPKDTDVKGECSGGASHTDPSGRHPEGVLRVDSLVP